MRKISAAVDQGLPTVPPARDIRSFCPDTRNAPSFASGTPFQSRPSDPREAIPVTPGVPGGSVRPYWGRTGRAAANYPSFLEVLG